MPRRVAIAFPVPLRRTFVYDVPDPWTDRALIGCRVAAPLGGRTLSGVVVENDPAVPEGVEIRPLAALLDDDPAVGPELLETTRVLSKRFFSAWGEILRAALPAGLPSAEPTRYEATLAGVEAASRAEPADRALLDRVLEAGRTPAAVLAAEGGLARVRELERRGWIRPVGARGRQRATRAMFSAIVPDAGADLARSARGRAAWEFLRSLGRPASSDEMKSAGFSSALIRRLVERGAVSRVDEERPPDEGAALPPASASPAFSLSPDQEAALEAVRRASSSRQFAPFLLFGVTGSGKTEVYLRAIGDAITAGRGAIWLVPEIALTPVFARSLQGRFGDAAVVLHSAMGDSARARAWSDMKTGRARAVIGPRSAVFAPIADIGLFVVDEEHDSSYKQDESPRYDARDAAALRAQAHGAVLLLGSATPALETWHASEEGKISRIELPRRIERRPLPSVEVVDLRGVPALPEEKGVPLFSPRLVDLLRAVFGRGEQAILLAPRRGYAPFLLCRACGHAFPCPNCSVSAVVHRSESSLRCHYCGWRRRVPGKCDACGNRHLEPIGAGTERAAERFAELFPGVRFAVLDSDTVRRRGGAAAVISSMEHGNIQALIGTQMVAKGHHFPNVTAIGVLSADTVLNLPDFRAAEKTFQLIAQVAGRSGRGERPGAVLVQTFHPDDPAIRSALAHDAAAFAREESEFRRTFFYPPFSEMAEIVVASKERERAASVSADLATALATDDSLRVTPAAPAPLERIAGKWRYQVLVRSRSRRAVLAALARAVPEAAPAGVAIAVDVDPRNLM